ncbi:MULTISPECIES: beta-ketoacyl-ACP synthase [unclassified Anabaena]|uniref:beta-ketoacyl-ACP synthase n=1 Tax=unclassified Anabaena TaxID=2619674 RepID=UPI0008378AC9|nr:MULTISPECIES: beta-ketoacyl-ACP synthase [unclassified Anabaena]
MVEIVITGIGLVSALGKSLEESWQKLITGESGIRLHQPFPELSPLPLGLIGEQPAKLRALTQHVVEVAIKDAGLLTNLPDCAVVIGSSRSHQASWEDLARKMYAKYPSQYRYTSGESLENWLETLPQMNAIAAARQIGATGIVSAPMAACATGIWAISQAALLIQTGQCPRAIAGAVEAPITPLTISGFQQMGALAKTGAYPFDVNREGLVLGEGAAVFVLETKELAQQRQAKIYGKVLGFGLTADAYHTNQPDLEGRGAIAAIKQSLERSHLTPQDIDYIHTHGTATPLNDHVESKVIKKLFPHQVPISSTKGATGHTLGASGAMGVAFTLLAMQQNILPPCVGLHKPEFDLNIVKTALHSPIRQALCLSFGFGGQNAVVVLGQSTL